MDAQDRVICIGADIEAGCDHRAIIPALGVDMLHIRDRHDDLFQRFGHLLHHVRRLQARCGDHDVHHGHGDLRFFLTRNGQQGDQPHGQRSQQEKRCQGRANGCARDGARNVGFHRITPVSRYGRRGEVRSGFHIGHPCRPAAQPARQALPQNGRRQGRARSPRHNG